MRILKATALAALLATPAFADGHTGPKIYSYNTHANYCPAGLQPVTMDGVICCGQPNQAHSYQQVMSHPTGHKRVHRARASQVSCPPGTKGCVYN